MNELNEIVGFKITPKGNGFHLLTFKLANKEEKTVVLSTRELSELAQEIINYLVEYLIKITREDEEE